MSELEQNLYKKLSVASSTKELPGSRTYRGFSSATNDKSFKVYDHEAIKQDIISKQQYQEIWENNVVRWLYGNQVKDFYHRIA